MSNKHCSPNLAFLSGFDPNKQTTLMYLLSTFMAARAKLDIRNLPDSKTQINPCFITKNEFLFALPEAEQEINIVIDLISYSLNDLYGKKSDKLYVKPVSCEIPKPENTDMANVNVYSFKINEEIFKEENDFFFIVRYRYGSGQIKHGYLFYFKNIIKTEHSDISRYIRYLASGNLCLNDEFIVFKPSNDVLIESKRIPNKKIDIPDFNDNSLTEIDFIILPVVYKHAAREEIRPRLQRKETTEAVVKPVAPKPTVSKPSYYISKASDLEECCELLFDYIKAVHDANIIPSNLIDFRSEPIEDIIISNKILISTFVTNKMRTINYIILKDSNIARLVFGPNVRWFIVNTSSIVKSPGNGALPVSICEEASDRGAGSLCSELSRTVNGRLNEFMGRSTSFLEDIMITDANFQRSVKGTNETYKELTRINTDAAYLANYGSFFELIAKLRNNKDPNYSQFVTILQNPKKFKGERDHSVKEDSTKLSTVIDWINSGQGNEVPSELDYQIIKRIDGGVYIANKVFTQEKARSIFCPYGYHMNFVRKVFDLFGPHLSFFIPRKIKGGLGNPYSENKNEVMSPVTGIEGRPGEAKPNIFFLNEQKSQVNDLVYLRDNAMNYFRSFSFFNDMINSTSNMVSFIMGVIISVFLSSNERKNIYDLLPNELIDYSPSAVEVDDFKKLYPNLYQNMIYNCDVSIQPARFKFLKQNKASMEEEFGHIIEKIKEYAKENEVESKNAVFEVMSKHKNICPIDIINGYLLSTQFDTSHLNNTMMDQLHYNALNASIYHSEIKIDFVDLIKFKFDQKKSIFVNVANAPLCGSVGNTLYIYLNETAFSNVSSSMFEVLRSLKIKSGGNIVFDWLSSTKTEKRDISLYKSDYMYKKGIVQVYSGTEPSPFNRASSSSVKTSSIAIETNRSKSSSSPLRRLTFRERLQNLAVLNRDNSSKLTRSRHILECAKEEWRSILSTRAKFVMDQRHEGLFMKRLSDIKVNIRDSIKIESTVYNVEDYANMEFNDFFTPTK